MGELLSEIGRDAWNAAEFIGQHGVGAEWVSGPIIDDIVSYVDSCATMWKSRMAGIGTTTADSGLELREAAWLYHDQDQQNYEALNKHKSNIMVTGDQSVPVYADRAAVGAVQAYEGAAKYSKPAEVKLDIPTANKEELVELIGSAFEPIGAVNDTVKRITKDVGREFDPLGEVLKQVPGNWSEIRRIGESYKVAGQAMEACGKNLESGLKRLAGSAAGGTPNWDGKAAIAFEDWANRQIAAMKWEGPTGRLIAEALGEVTNQLRDAIHKALQWLWDLLEIPLKVTADSVAEAFKVCFRKIPVVGWAATVTEMAIKVVNIVNDVIQLIDKIRALVDKVKQFLEIVKDPVKSVQEGATQRFEELVQPFAKGVKAGDILEDAAKSAQLNDTINRPDERFDSGDGQNPWANA
ncbi:hypothetical protein [Nocardia sp. NPDC058480]|uniref:hypothetical protein n=1 Tax=unclassified Nocardia TaxID=2637762 RepID=UPI0036660199